MRRISSLVPGALQSKLWYDTRPQIVASAQRLVVHLRRRQGVGEMVVLQARRRRMQKLVDVSYGLVRAVPLLEVYGRRE